MERVHILADPRFIISMLQSSNWIWLDPKLQIICNYILNLFIQIVFVMSLPMEGLKILGSLSGNKSSFVQADFVSM